jgi:hypothetical protein
MIFEPECWWKEKKLMESKTPQEVVFGESLKFPNKGT